MKKNLRVIQINGIRGVFITLFIISCLVAGFIVFPAFVIMNTWNYISFKLGDSITLNFVEGILLWTIIAFSVFVFSKKRFIISLNSPQELTEDEVKEVVSKIKSQTLNNNTLLPKEFNDSKENKEELKEVQTNKIDN